MFKNIIVAASATYLILLSFPLIVSAQENQELTQSQESNTTQSVEQENDNQPGRTLEERLNKAKEKASEQISAAQQRRVEARCTNAQEKITNLRTKLSDSIENRRNAYTKVSTKLNELTQKLEAAGVDSTGLSAVVSEMDARLVSSRLSVDNYMQSLADLTEMDCESDPVGFKALLQEAREKRAEILSSQLGLKEFKDETLKPALQEIRESLSSLESGE